MLGRVKHQEAVELPPPRVPKNMLHEYLPGVIQVSLFLPCGRWLGS